jgi:hypothetical protein
VLVTDGPYTETKEHIGGFWILEAADLDEALAWAKKAAITCDVRRSARASFLPGPEGSNGIVSPAATSEDARNFLIPMGHTMADICAFIS